MKKLIAILAVLVLAGGGIYFVYQKSYGGDHYYVKITKDGTATKETDDSGATYTNYTYNLPAVNKKLDKKNIEFNADHNLRKQAYLELTVNKNKGVTSFKEVKKSEIKSEIIKELN